MKKQKSLTINKKLSARFDGFSKIVRIISILCACMLILDTAARLRHEASHQVADWSSLSYYLLSVGLLVLVAIVGLIINIRILHYLKQDSTRVDHPLRYYARMCWALFLNVVCYVALLLLLFGNLYEYEASNGLIVGIIAISIYAFLLIIAATSLVRDGRHGVHTMSSTVETIIKVLIYAHLLAVATLAVIALISSISG